MKYQKNGKELHSSPEAAGWTAEDIVLWNSFLETAPTEFPIHSVNRYVPDDSKRRPGFTYIAGREVWEVF